MKYIPYLIFSILFIFIWGLRPPISSDSFYGLSNRPLKIVEELSPRTYSSGHTFDSQNNETGLIREKESPVLFYKSSKTIYTLMLENKHSGLTIVLYKLFSHLIEPGLAFIIWHYLGGLLILFLLLRVLKILYDDNYKLISLVVSSSPFLIFLYVFFISEVFIFAFFLLIIENILNKKKETNFYLIGLYCALGFYVRLNFLWLALAIIPFLEFRFKSYIKVLASCLVFSIPHIFLIDWSGLLSKAEYYQMNFGFVENISFFIFAFFNSWKSFTFLWDEGYQRSLFDPFSLFSSDVISLSLLIGFLIILIKNKLYNRNKFRKIALASFIFVASLFFTLKLQVDYTNYFYPIFIFQVLVLGEVLRTISKQRLRIVVASLFLINSSIVYVNYFLKDVVIRHNLNVAAKVVDELSKRRKDLYTVGESDIGKYEYLSRGKLKPVHLAKLINSKELATIYDVLEKTGEGTIAIPYKDEWSAWYLNWGDIESERVKALAKDLQINIHNEKIIYDNVGHKAVWIFDYNGVKVE